MMYTIEKIAVGEYYKDSNGKYHEVIAETLASGTSWRDLMKKESDWWYAGKGCVIFLNGKRLGDTWDLLDAISNRYDNRTGDQLQVRLRDFLEAATENSNNEGK